MSLLTRNKYYILHNNIYESLLRVAFASSVLWAPLLLPQALFFRGVGKHLKTGLLYPSPTPRDRTRPRMPSPAGKKKKTMTSKQRSSHFSSAAPLVYHGMQKWPSPRTAATVKDDEKRRPMANYTCPSHPETNNIMKLSRNWGQPPATHLTMNKRRARSKGGTLSLFQ